MKNRVHTALEKDVLSRMMDNLFTVEGRTVEINELAFTLFECENIGDISDIVGDLSDTYNLRLEVLENTEKFMVIVVMFVAQDLAYDLIYGLEPFHSIIAGGVEGELPYTITFDEATINAITDEITAIIGKE